MQQAFDRAAGRYDSYAEVQRAVLQQLLAIGRDAVPATARVLDAGCGTGMLADLARDAGLEWKLTGLDVAPSMCVAARQRGMVVLCADVEALPIAGHAMDAMVSSLVWQWLPEPQRAMQEMRRVLTPDGVALVAVVVEGTLRELGNVLHSIDETPRMTPFQPADWWTAQLEQAGWQIAQFKQWSHCQYFPDAVSVMRSLRGLGASNRHPERSRGMRGRSFLQRVENTYAEQYATSQGLPASWEVALFVLR